jgi:hypothetical protein
LTDQVKFVGAGPPVGVAWRSILSPAVTATVCPLSEQVVPAPVTVHVTPVGLPFLSTVNVQVAAPPGAVLRKTLRADSVPVFDSMVSTGASVGDTLEKPQAM